MADARDVPTDDELLSYVAGRLEAADVARVEAAAAADPVVAADIALMKGARTAFADEVEAPPGDLGWARLSRAMSAEATPARGAARPRILQLAATAAAAVLVWQVAAVPMLPSLGIGTPQYAPVSQGPADGSIASVAFAPNVTEADLRALLIAVGAEVTAGPSAIGLWQLSFADDAARDAALQTLRGSPLVERAQSEN